MVAFVLDAAAHQLLALDDHLLAVQVDAHGPRIPCASGRVPQARHGQAALIPVLILLEVQLVDPRVEDVADLSIDVPGEGAHPHTDLIGGQPRATVVVNRLEQVLDQCFDRVVDVRDPLALRAQDGVADDADVAVCHGRILARRPRSRSPRAGIRVCRGMPRYGEVCRGTSRSSR